MTSDEKLEAILGLIASKRTWYQRSVARWKTLALPESGASELTRSTALRLMTKHSDIEQVLHKLYIECEWIAEEAGQNAVS